MISGDICPRKDIDREQYVAILSNDIHLAAGTGRVITCPFIPGQLPDDAIALSVDIERPKGLLLPELIHWLPTSALDEPIGHAGGRQLRTVADMVAAMILP